MENYKFYKGRDIPSVPHSVRQSAEWDVLVHVTRADIQKLRTQQTNASQRDRLDHEYGGWKTTGLFVAKEQGTWRVGMGASDKALREFGKPLNLKWCYRVFYELENQRFRTKKEALVCIDFAGQIIIDQLVKEGFLRIN